MEIRDWSLAVPDESVEVFFSNGVIKACLKQERKKLEKRDF